MVYTFTSSAPNYFPKVKILRDSIKRFSPHVKFVWLVADLYDENLVKTVGHHFDDLIFVNDLEISADIRWTFGHNLVELATAVKPNAAINLLKRSDAKGVVYYDPDMVLFSDVDEIYDRLSSSSILLTPHICMPEKTVDHVLDNEIGSLKHGVFNLGFFGVSRSAEAFRFLDWWNERLRHFCRTDLNSGVFTDQKWLNFAPIFFEGVEILKNSRFNVATWNITQRTMTGCLSEGIQIDGEPLGFYHFTGFDKGAHERMALKYAPELKPLHELIQWYKSKSAEEAQNVNLPSWRLGTFSNGEAITDAHRKLYRERPDVQKEFPDPYSAIGTNNYYAWYKLYGSTELATT